MGQEEKSRKAVSFLRPKQPWLQSASKSSLAACISLTRGLAGPSPSHEAWLCAEHPLCPTCGTHPHPRLHPLLLWHSPGNLPWVAVVLPRLLSLPGTPGRLQPPAVSMLIEAALQSWGGLWRGSGEKQRCKGGHRTGLGSPRGARVLDASPKEKTWEKNFQVSYAVRISSQLQMPCCCFLDESEGGVRCPGGSWREFPLRRLKLRRWGLMLLAPKQGKVPSQARTGAQPGRISFA